MAGGLVWMEGSRLGWGRVGCFRVRVDQGLQSWLRGVRFRVGFMVDFVLPVARSLLCLRRFSNGEAWQCQSSICSNVRFPPLRAHLFQAKTDMMLGAVAIAFGASFCIAWPGRVEELTCRRPECSHALWSRTCGGGCPKSGNMAFIHLSYLIIPPINDRFCGKKEIEQGSYDSRREEETRRWVAANGTDQNLLSTGGLICDPHPYIGVPNMTDPYEQRSVENGAYPPSHLS